MKHISVLMMALACSTPPPPAPVGTFDAGTRRDSARARPDTGAADVGGDGSDAGPLPCEPELFALAGAADIEVGQASVHAADDFLSTWNRDDGVWAARVTRAAAGSPMRLSPEGAIVESPVASADLVVWSQLGEGGQFDLVARSVENAPLGEPENVSAEPSHEMLPAATSLQGDWLVAWIDLAATPRLQARRWGGTASAATYTIAEGVEAQAPAMTERTDDIMVVWRQGTNVQMALVDGGGITREPVAINDGEARGGVALASHARAALVLFESGSADGMRHLHVRLLDADGVPGVEHRLSQEDEIQTSLGQVATHRGGWIVTYRAELAAGPQVRAAFLHAETAERVRTIDIAPSFSNAGSVAVGVTDDGTILASWASAAARGSVRAARIDCAAGWDDSTR